MLHNPKRLRQIETWSRWIAWFNLVSVIGYLVFFGYRIATSTLFLYLESTFIPSGLLGFWEKASEITKSIYPIFGSLGSFFFLIGISKAVRFLRAYYAQITGGELSEPADL